MATAMAMAEAEVSFLGGIVSETSLSEFKKHTPAIINSWDRKREGISGRPRVRPRPQAYGGVSPKALSGGGPGEGREPLPVNFRTLVPVKETLRQEEVDAPSVGIGQPCCSWPRAQPS